MKPATEIPVHLMDALKTAVSTHGVKDAARRVRLSRDTVQVTISTGRGGTKVMDRLAAYAAPKASK